MAYTYNIETSKKDMRSSVCLFVDHKLSVGIKIFLSTFLVAYIYTFSDNLFNYILNVGLFEIAGYITMPIVYFAMAYFVDKTNRVWIYRVGMVLRAVLVVFAIFFGKDLSKLIVLAGFLNGFSEGVYYAAYNTLLQEMVSRKSMRSFMVVSNIVTKIADIVFPIVLGALIEVSTFTQVAIYVFGLCVVQICISIGIRAKKPEDSFFSLKQYFKDLKQNQVAYDKMKLIYWISFVYGFTTIITTIANIFIMTQFGSNFSLGLLTSIFAAISIVTILIVNKVTKAGKRSVFLAIVAVLQLACAIIFAAIPNVYTLIVYNLGNSVGYIIYRTIFDVHRNANLKENGLYGGITEHQLIMECLFDVSRALSYGVMILLGYFQNMIAFQVFLVLSFAFAGLVFVLLIIYEKKFCRGEPENKVKNE